MTVSPSEGSPQPYGPYPDLNGDVDVAGLLLEHQVAQGLQPLKQGNVAMRAVTQRDPGDVAAAGPQLRVDTSMMREEHND